MCAVASAAAVAPLRAQGAVARDTIYLDDAQHAAERADRRAAQVALIAQQSALRQRAIRSELLPTVNATATAQYLSDVANVGAVLPGTRIPAPANDQYDGYLSVRQPLVDPLRRPRVRVEQAQETDAQARVRTALFQQRAAVSEAFFGAALRTAQVQSLDVAIADLDARLKVAATRVTAGAALPSEQLLLQAELERRRQSRGEVQMDRDAARDVLAALINRDVPANAVYAVRAAVSSAVYAAEVADTLHARPEFAQYATARALLDARRAASAAQDLPRVSLFGRSGYGRPGLNPLGRSFDAYWTAGVQVEWSAWNWGRTKTELEAQVIQQEIVRSDEAAFGDGLRRAAIATRAQVRSLERMLVADDSIIALRDRILRETRLRFDEGEVTAADYVARLSEQLSATLDRDTRRVRLDEARARYLTTLGLEVR
jgi:outer membrane protein TolC